ncbi:hypothetical protein D1606_05270 [Rummeliibacillus sp. POC4]|nr:hypothetical protein D1606_05270 [Rummeliibacillus sp. POC4]
MILNKGKLATILGILSILSVIVSFILLNALNTDIFFKMITFNILSTIGFILAVTSLIMSISSRCIRLLLIGFVGITVNALALLFGFLLFVMVTGI